MWDMQTKAFSTSKCEILCFFTPQSSFLIILNDRIKGSVHAKKRKKKEKKIYIYRNKQGMMFGLMKDCSKYQYLFPDWGAQW